MSCHDILILVFDTTASNSGIHRGAAKLLEERLEKKVFYFACCHHILEVIVGAAWETVFDKVKSPEKPLFKEVKEKWDDLRKDRPKVLKPVEGNLKEKRMQAIAVLKKILQVASPRADYREVADL